MTAALVAAVAVYVAVTLPPRPLALAPPTDGTIPGIIHVHSNRSDGLSGPDEIAAAASLLQGQAAEAQPVVVVRGLTWTAPNMPVADVIRPPEEDLFQ